MIQTLIIGALLMASCMLLVAVILSIAGHAREVPVTMEEQFGIEQDL